MDKAVDAFYRPQAFTEEAKRRNNLFELYERYTAGLFAVEKERKKEDLKGRC
ncbi:type IIL restriction-modification enzyme MmeI [Pontibacter populi]|uniref:Type IIL restriction-modification enzyme MmeI n=1 Tax=Pontibacter populi TaxID=890055 RepID=A0ABV1RXS8_9BACT